MLPLSEGANRATPEQEARRALMVCPAPDQSEPYISWMYDDDGESEAALVDQFCMARFDVRSGKDLPEISWTIRGNRPPCFEDMEIRHISGQSLIAQGQLCTSGAHLKLKPPT